jgi:hypothetical protein
MPVNRLAGLPRSRHPATARRRTSCLTHANRDQRAVLAAASPVPRAAWPAGRGWRCVRGGLARCVIPRGCGRLACLGGLAGRGDLAMGRRVSGRGGQAVGGWVSGCGVLVCPGGLAGCGELAVGGWLGGRGMLSAIGRLRGRDRLEGPGELAGPGQGAGRGGLSEWVAGRGLVRPATWSEPAALAGRGRGCGRSGLAGPVMPPKGRRLRGGRGLTGPGRQRGGARQPVRSRSRG